MTTGDRAVGVRCDVTSNDDVAAAYATTMSTFGRADIVMSNVGVIAKGLPEDIPLDAWSSILDINVLGTVRILAAFLPHLLERGSGHLVTTGSTAGLFPYAYDRLPYAASKAAVVAMTESLALYLRPKGIGVSCFCPAGVITNIVEQIRVYGAPTAVQAPQIPLITAEQAGELVGARHPRRRAADPHRSHGADDGRTTCSRRRRLPARADRILGGRMSADERWDPGAAEFTAVTGMPAPTARRRLRGRRRHRPGLRRDMDSSRPHSQGAPVDRDHVRIDDRGAVRDGDAYRRRACGRGDITIEEMREFVLQFAAYAGHPKATAVRARARRRVTRHMKR